LGALLGHVAVSPDAQVIRQSLSGSWHGGDPSLVHSLPTKAGQ
jgi:hypothetical protein